MAKHTPFVYVLECPALGVTKVGFTKNLQQRLLDLQATIPADLILIAHFPASMSEEWRIHKQLRDAHERGEWFRSCHPVVQDYVRSLPDRPGVVMGVRLHPPSKRPLSYTKDRDIPRLLARKRTGPKTEFEAMVDYQGQLVYKRVCD